MGIDDGFYYNTRFPGNIFGSHAMQDIIRNTPDTGLSERMTYLETVPYSPEYGWTVRNFGPMYIPAAGSRVVIDTSSVNLYGRAIEYETGILPEIRDGEVYMAEDRINDYVFRTDWYFFGGDNVLNSKDSRYVGLVPEDYIVGIATRILFSRSPCTGRFDRTRFMKKIVMEYDE